MNSASLPSVESFGGVSRKFIGEYIQKKEKKISNKNRRINEIKQSSSDR
jgi:hypothetical protein